VLHAWLSQRRACGPLAAVASPLWPSALPRGERTAIT
jgi:hypothetical protein